MDYPGTMITSLLRLFLEAIRWQVWIESLAVVFPNRQTTVKRSFFYRRALRFVACWSCFVAVLMSPIGSFRDSNFHCCRCGRCSALPSKSDPCRARSRQTPSSLSRVLFHDHHIVSSYERFCSSSAFLENTNYCKSDGVYQPILSFVDALKAALVASNRKTEWCHL